jgi:RNA polymerase sigma-70 factor (ECF subfamily)
MERITEQNPLRHTELRLHALFLQGLDGDAKAYRSFLQATTPYLRAFLRRRLAAWPDQVEDLVQESLLAIHNQRQSYDTGLPVTAWIYAIARYKLIDWLRRHARQDSMLQPLDDEDAVFERRAGSRRGAARCVETIGRTAGEAARRHRPHQAGWTIRARNGAVIGHVGSGSQGISTPGLEGAGGFNARRDEDR